MIMKFLPPLCWDQTTTYGKMYLIKVIKPTQSQGSCSFAEPLPLHVGVQIVVSGLTIVRQIKPFIWMKRFLMNYSRNLKPKEAMLPRAMLLLMKSVTTFKTYWAFQVRLTNSSRLTRIRQINYLSNWNCRLIAWPEFGHILLSIWEFLNREK